MGLRNSLILFLALSLSTSLLYAQSDTTQGRKPAVSPTPTVVCPAYDKDYKVGDRGPAGGWIIWVIYKKPADTACWKYLEAAPYDLYKPIWSNVQEPVGTYTAIATGGYNTQKIIAQAGHRASGAKACRDLVVNYNGQTFIGWSLPSKDELALMYQQLRLNGNKSGFEGRRYWSSSENSADHAWFQDFLHGPQETTDKNIAMNVRCVRAF